MDVALAEIIPVEIAVAVRETHGDALIRTWLLRDGGELTVEPTTEVVVVYHETPDVFFHLHWHTKTVNLYPGNGVVLYPQSKPVRVVAVAKG